ncbi:MAG: hypothetical protein FWC88_02390, partial [Endomicrobia bacterium]|nr:hypothetical protein [Endomicrobiia bacterium]
MKIKKMISLFVAAVMTVNAAPVFSAVKRDVNDPVLREIINEFSTKMPKFIDRYGETVFVEEEPVTRGSLLQALYEYDKRTRSAVASLSADASKTFITRQEFDSLKNKISSFEKKGGKSSDGVDIVQLISDLTPNMPMLLDSSLKNSKVFRELQQQVESGGGSGFKGSASLLKNIDSLNVKVDMLSKRMDLTSNQIAGLSKTGPNKGGDSEFSSKDI